MIKLFKRPRVCYVEAGLAVVFTFLFAQSLILCWALPVRAQSWNSQEEQIKRAMQLERTENRVATAEEQLKALYHWRSDVIEPRMASLERQNEKFSAAFDMFKIFNTSLAIPVFLLLLNHFVLGKRRSPSD